LLQTKVIQAFDKHNNVVDTLLEFYGTSTLLVPKPPTSDAQSRLGNSRGKSDLDKRVRKISSEKPAKIGSSNASERPDAVVPYAAKPITKL
jgi:hypothetical protein